jgi:large subunit ribosomal protein L14
MIQLRSKLTVADNSGAKEMYVIHVYGGNKQIAHLGDIVQCVIQKADPTGIVKDDELVKVVIVRTRKETRRADGSYIRFDDNAGVVINSKEDPTPKGTRVFGPVARELKDAFPKIVSLATEVW